MSKITTLLLRPSKKQNKKHGMELSHKIRLHSKTSNIWCPPEELHLNLSLIGAMPASRFRQSPRCAQLYTCDTAHSPHHLSIHLNLSYFPSRRLSVNVSAALHHHHRLLSQPRQPPRHPPACYRQQSLKMCAHHYLITPCKHTRGLMRSEPWLQILTTFCCRGSGDTYPHSSPRNGESKGTLSCQHIFNGLQYNTKKDLSHLFDCYRVTVVSPTVFDAYKKLSGSDIEDSIEGETSGNLENLLLAVGKTIELWGRHWRTVNRRQRAAMPAGPLGWGLGGGGGYEKEKLRFHTVEINSMSAKHDECSVVNASCVLSLPQWSVPGVSLPSLLNPCINQWGWVSEFPSISSSLFAQAIRLAPCNRDYSLINSWSLTSFVIFKSAL